MLQPGVCRSCAALPMYPNYWHPCSHLSSNPTLLKTLNTHLEPRASSTISYQLPNIEISYVKLRKIDRSAFIVRWSKARGLKGKYKPMYHTQNMSGVLHTSKQKKILCASFISILLKAFLIMVVISVPSIIMSSLGLSFSGTFFSTLYFCSFFTWLPSYLLM